MQVVVDAEDPGAVLMFLHECLCSRLPLGYVGAETEERSFRNDEQPGMPHL